MTAEPLWISVAGGRLFGVLHMPDVPVRAGIILCPPFFHEQGRSQRLFALLADALRGHGFAVLRFDYLGTGDSEGSDESFTLLGAARSTAHPRGRTSGSRDVQARKGRTSLALAADPAWS